jgi:hypothetical protein
MRENATSTFDCSNAIVVTFSRDELMNGAPGIESLSLSTTYSASFSKILLASVMAEKEGKCLLDEPILSYPRNGYVDRGSEVGIVKNFLKRFKRIRILDSHYLISLCSRYLTTFGGTIVAYSSVSLNRSWLDSKG